MTRLALLCSGQGLQHADMFALTAEAEAAQPIFAAADAVLGRDVRALARSGQGRQDNVAAQVLCCTQALAATAALADALAGHELIVAGYSVGELAAWGVAGLFSPNDGLRLARCRAQAMDEAAVGTPGGLAAIRGLPRAKVEALCRDHGTHVAIVNGADQIVIGGANAALHATLGAARAAGAGKVTELAVSVASHTPLLRAAVAPFRQALSESEARPLAGDRRILSGVDGASVVSIDDGLDKLSRQVARTIDWRACMETCQEAGVARALELGPGNALAHLMSDHLGARNSRSLDDFRTLDGVRRWLTA